MNRVNNLDYLNYNSSLTLKEGILELRAAEFDDDVSENISFELARDIDEHDAIHALFGCTTDLNGEILAHIWTIFGTTMKIQQMYHVNKKQDHKQALKEIGHFKLLSNWILRFPKLIAALYYSKKMKRKFPVDNFEQYLDTSLFELRNMFGIKLIE